MKILDIKRKYHNKLDLLDLELLIANAIKKPREFVLAHPEYKLTKNQELKTKNLIFRRIKGEPLAYILRHKEFFGLDFKVNKNTLVPRPETELLVEEALDLLRSMLRSKVRNIVVADVGTGSGNIIISVAKAIKNFKFFGTDISGRTLKIAGYNAKKHGVDKKIKFLKGNLLEPFTQDTKYKIQDTNLIILANLPYLSPAIYKSTMADVKKYEPKTALLSDNHGLAHYKKLLKQIKLLVTSYGLLVTIVLEISPEQKPRLAKIIKKYFPSAKIEFKKDLARKWRACIVKI